MSPCQSPSGTSPAPQPLLVPVRFDVCALPPRRQLLVWRERVGQFIDVVPTHAQIESPFRAFFDRYAVGDYVFNDCYSDQVTLNRSIARISQDNARSIVFHIFLEGHAGGSIARAAKHDSTSLDVGILAVDLDQPVQMSRRACRHVNLFVPVSRIQQVFADPGVLHGRVLAPQLPAVRLIAGRASTLLRSIPMMSPDEAWQHLDALLALILAAYGVATGLAGGRRALARAATFDRVRHFVRVNLDNGDLTPEYVIESLGLSRPTVYRLFQHEGGLGNYIQYLRLRTAADELRRFPQVQIQDVLLPRLWERIGIHARFSPGFRNRAAGDPARAQDARGRDRGAGLNWRSAARAC